MSVRKDLVEWQWRGYPSFHGSRMNLLLHLVAVPSFIISTLNLVWGLVLMQWQVAVFSLGGMAIAFAVQAVGHSKEKTPALPFEGAADAVTRIFLEQFFTFPRFVVSGGWWRAYQAAPAEE